MKSIHGQGTSSRASVVTQAATAQALRALVEDYRSSRARWERQASLGLEMDDIDRALLAETVRRAQERRGFLFDNPKDPVATLSKLSLVRSGLLTNAADVLFGKSVALRHPQTRLRAVRFASDRADDFLDEHLFEGPAFQLLEDATAFVKRHIPIEAEFPAGQLARKTKPLYPFNAVREGLVNALVHRDYAAFSGSVSVNIYPDRIEIWNTGRLPRSISPRDLVSPSHSSILVNPDIGHVFYLHELMERVGRGTYKIAQECRSFGMHDPEWKNVASGVRLTMYAARGDQPTGPALNDRQKALLDALKRGEKIGVNDYADQFGGGDYDAHSPPGPSRPRESWSSRSTRRRSPDEVRIGQAEAVMQRSGHNRTFQ